MSPERHEFMCDARHGFGPCDMGCPPLWRQRLGRLVFRARLHRLGNWIDGRF